MKVTDIINTFLDTFGGSDGGESFLKFKFILEEMEQKAEAGDTAAHEVIDRVAGVARLIKYATTTSAGKSLDM